MKTPFQRIVGINLIVMLLVALATSLPRGSMNTRLGFSMVSAGIFVFIAFVNIGFAIFGSTPQARQAHWLSLLLALLIGFGNCAVQFS